MPRRALGLLISVLAVCAEQLPHRVFTTADGLARNTITRIRRDPQGYLWICTVEGLSLFDGSRFMNYAVADGLPDRHVNDILPAGDGSYWLATSGGLFRFRPRRALAAGQNQSPWFEPVRRTDGSPSESLSALMKDRQGRIWAAGRSGLYRLRGNPAGLEPAPLAPGGSPVTTLYEDPAGRVWIGAGDGLYRLSEKTGSAVRVYAARDVAAIHMDKGGRLWIGEWGLTSLDVERDPPRKLEHLGGETSLVLVNRVSAIRDAPGGELWIAGYGLGRLRPGSQPSIGRFHPVDTSPEWTQYCLALEADDGGNVWAGVNGMGLLAIAAARLVHYTEADGLTSTKVAGMLADRPRPLLITESPYRWNEFDGHRFVTMVPRIPSPVRSMGWGDGSIVLQTRDREWWVSSESGLLRYPAAESPRQLAGVPPKQVLGPKDGLPNVILQLFEDSRGDLWAGGLEGVARRESASGQWHMHFTTGLAGESRAVERIAEDHAGAVWLSLHNLGLERFRAGRFEEMPRGVPRGINSLFVDSRGRLWIASGEGLGRIDHPETAAPEIRRYGVADGLSSADLFSVGEDRYGRIYVAGGKGVDLLNPETGQARHLALEDGFRGEPQHVFRDLGGAMWFVGLFGVSRYQPGGEEYSAPPSPVFRSVRISGKRSMVSDLGESSIPAFDLRPGETGLDIEMAAVRLGSGEKIRYQYRLGESGWSAPIETPMISLAGLSPGKYRLLVRTIDGSGLTSPSAATMEFQAWPSWWRRWWVRMLIVAACLASAAAFHRLRLNRLLELERVRSSIAADLHDDIGSSLTQVAVLSEVAHRRAHDTATVQKHTEKIAAICRELVDSTSDIVWAVSPRHDSLSDLAQRMREFAGELLAARDVAFRLDVSASAHRLRMGADARRQSYLIFKEAVHNAARHSGATEVDIRLGIEGAWLVLGVEDNGRGLANGHGNGHGLANMRRRAEAMGGIFEAGGESGGTRVRVRLPLR